MSGVNAVGLPAAPGGHRAAGPVLRASVYYDGFNLYHALDDLGEPHLKWLNLYALAERFVRRGHAVSSVLWCSAQNTWSREKQDRHRAYRAALEAVNVEYLLGHFVKEPLECRVCKQEYWKNTEKEGDVNVAIRLISDGHLDEYDVAYLVSADSDQVATFKLFKKLFPEKQVVSVAPPGRAHSKDLISHSHGYLAISRASIEASLFGAVVTKDGKTVAQRPTRGGNEPVKVGIIVPAILLAGCAETYPDGVVQTREQAITTAKHVCDETTGNDPWSAHLTGYTWLVVLGGRGGLQVSIDARDGSTDGCVVIT